ncbi:MAG: FAD-dependent oxidoreductase [Candidatus Marinimicrobia bacterium]|nr:FAD-dependent oxidoreductase [Candidatus Neomarinimicrobiota bacterium]
MSSVEQLPRVAVIGAGISGLTAAYLLRARYAVTLFERNDYLGGHTRTVTLPAGAPDAGTPVDTGFIVMNHRNYPLLTRLFAELAVPLRDSDMSFGYWDQATGIQYAGGTLSGLWAEPRLLLRPAYWRMIADVMRFYKRAPGDLAAGRLRGLTLGQMIRQHGYGAWFAPHHLLPMAAAIWSTPCEGILDYPAESLVRFFANHGLLQLSDRPQWRTVVGGSQIYVERLRARLTGAVRLETPVLGVRRAAGRPVVRTAAGEESFDHVVIATHADEAHALLADEPGAPERVCLAPWRYERNGVVLHTDRNALPPRRGAWASWNYCRETGNPAVSLTYDMNRLQGLDTQRHYLVTLNRQTSLAPGCVLDTCDFQHPSFTFPALEARAQLEQLNGRDGVFFCGAYFGNGFHEDGCRSGVRVAQALGVAWPAS